MCYMDIHANHTHTHRRKVEAKQEGREDPEDEFAKRLQALKIVAQEKAAV